jgi:hypothetical protein
MPFEAEGVLAGAPDLVRRHGAGILLALMLAAVLVSPRWFVLTFDAEEGQRIPISPYGAGSIGYDEALYAASVRQAYEGTLPVSDPNLVNHSSDVPQRSAFPHEAIGLIGRFTGGIFPALAIVTTVAAAAALLLLYMMLYRITGSPWVAAGLIPILLMAIEVFNHAEGILPLRHWGISVSLLKVDPLREVHVWSRFPAPILVLPAFFGAVVAFPRAVATGDRRWMAASILALVAMIYLYAYYWTAFALAIGLWAGAMLWQREFTQLGRLALIAGVSALLAVPEFVVLAQSVVSLPEDARDRVGLGDAGVDASLAVTMGQRLLLGVPLVAAALITKPRQVFYIALFLAPLILASLSGVIPQPWHFHTQVFGVFAIPLAAWGVYLVARSQPVREHAGAFGAAFAVIALVSMGWVVAMQSRAIVGTDEAFAVSIDEHEALTWIQENVEHDETVVSPSVTTNMLLASLTPASQYLGEGGFSTATDAELLDRLLRAQAAFGYSTADAFGRLDVSGEFEGYPVNDVRGSAAYQERALEDYLAFYTFSFEVSDQDAFTRRMEAQRSRYEGLLQTDGVLVAHEADYLYCGHRERFFGGSSTAPGTWVRPAHRSGEYTVYEIVGEGAPGAVEFAGC